MYLPKKYVERFILSYAVCIETYAMFVLLLTVFICKTIESLVDKPARVHSVSVN